MEIVVLEWLRIQELDLYCGWVCQLVAR